MQVLTSTNEYKSIKNVRPLLFPIVNRGSSGGIMCMFLRSSKSCYEIDTPENLGPEFYFLHRNDHRLNEIGTNRFQQGVNNNRYPIAN